METKISVIITCFNLDKYISRSINSVINQTLFEQLYEIIVVDDGSTDDSWSVISQYGDMGGQLKTIKNENNFGVSYTSNVGLMNASGKYLIKVDGDDFINKNTLLFMSEVLDNNPDIPFVYCDHIIIDKGNSRKLSVNTKKILLDHGAGVLLRTDNVRSIGGWNTNYKTRDDMDLMHRYIEKFGNGYHLKVPLYRYCKRENSLSTKKKQRDLESKIILQEKNV